jgi:DNA-binding beta-propeller fold protein YncE
VSNGDEVLIYPERPHNPSPIGCISTPVDSAHGLYVDAAGNLYVANGDNTVTVYAPATLTPSATYFVGSAGPMYPIADRNGNVFVSTNQGTVVEFLHDRAAPYRTLQTPGYEADGMAFDSSGNLYVTYRTAYLSGSIEKFAPGSTQGQVLGMEIIQPQGILVTPDGTIVVVETGRADGIYVFAKGSQSPQQTLKVGVHETPVQLALTQSEHELFLSTFGWLGSGHVYTAPYPLTASSHFQVKIVFRLRRDGHRRRHRWQIQGLALRNELSP